MSTTCPICAFPSRRVRYLSEHFLRESLAKYFGSPVPATIRILNYELHRCSQCFVEFAHPMVAGDADFYHWITSQPLYYPESRWEWQVVLDRIASSTRGSQTSLLEVGCGDGHFLSLASAIPRLRGCGLDLTQASVATCVAKGLDARCVALKDYLRTKQDNPPHDFMVTFHCLEHVEAPVDMMRDLIAAMKTDGVIFVSTPYSPMYFERARFDPLNHPPHHLTRWNERAYRQLANQLDLEVTLLLPPAASVWSRTLCAREISVDAENITHKRIQQLIALLREPIATFAEFFYQLRRPKVNAKPAADVILCAFRRKR